MLKKSVISIILFSASIIALTQNDESKFKLTTNYFQGFIIPEFGLLDSINESPLRTIELSFSKRSNGKHYWNDIYNYPEYGLAIFYTDMGDKDVLGEIFGIDYFFKINLIERNKTKFYLRSGIGINYTSRKYDPIDNPLNKSVGSNINTHFNLRFGLSKKIFSKTELNLGGSFDHISNATTKFPNLGVNYVSWYGGLIQHFGSNNERIVNEIPEHEREIAFSITKYFGSRHLKFPTNKHYYVPCLSLDIAHQTFRLMHFGIGLDGFHDSSIKPRMIMDGDPYKDSYAFLMGVHFNQTLVYNKFSFTLQEGFYFVKNSKVAEETMYNRVIFNYDILEKISLKIALRTHLHDLRYLESGISFKL
jgi:hypothetical protein